MQEVNSSFSCFFFNENEQFKEERERERKEQCNNTPILGKIWKPCADNEDSWQLYQFVVDLIQYFFTVNKKGLHVIH